MNLKDIMNEATKDLTIDPTELGIASLSIPQKHNKYLNLLRDESVLHKKLKIDYKTLRRLKWEYYLGKTDEETLERLGWEPFQLNILRQDVDRYLDSDDELNVLKIKVELCEEKMSHLESIIKNITNMQWNIKNAIDWKKFVSGQ
jgi:hypothetical protein|tara:strand:+ start:1165 stop:1599 length:435 start_codon:yes stop_codon:yes gene_type:complete